MSGRIRAVVIDPQDDSRAVIVRTLTESGRVEVLETTADYEKTPALVARLSPELVVLGLDGGNRVATELIRTIPERYPGVVILPVSSSRNSSLLLTVMRAGAREILSLPAREGELSGILDRLGRVGVTAALQPRRGPGTIAVVGAVGGVGCTTIAVNLAVGLASTSGASVLLADFDLLFGSADVALDILPEFTLLDATRKIDRVDESLLRRAIARHASGVHVLPRPVELEDAARVDPEALRGLLHIASRAFSSVVIDASKSLQSSDLVAFEVADVVLVVLQPDLIGLRNAARLLKLLRQDEALAAKIRLVSNRVGAYEAEIGPKKAEETLGMPIAWQVPNATKLVHEARSKGVPIGAQGPGSKVHLAIQAMAAALAPFPEKPAARRRRGLLARLF